MVQDQEDRALVFTYDYESGESFDVVAQLETSTTVDILQTGDGETVPEISQPDDYTGHVIRYNNGEGATAPTTLLFLSDQSLSADDSGSLGEDATMFSSRLNLLATTID
ncbi:hypothetical protein [Natronorubrum daqingense]|uniref:Uncharacterized protein n=1 Tax=Natronorubrum daqingense TaxID=588898 RepID=A0A1N7EVM9_9EURY|nr:hypothetical protein [Natronorubrum daqingense]APX97684.1 hypothetical protein BB347_14275 [Natronorubrum daqingense]SIR92161.1 hypothetical protein SAMN05421809_2898 [Natronorubrum daqingense]